MSVRFQIDPNLNIPIYQQLVDAIRAAIKQGNLSAGEQLPTVQEMATQLGIARGTIKRAYDELERAGLVEKIQGSGTFVRYQPAESGSRMEQAMAAIDGLLDQLESMGLPMSEIGIFVNLKLRERAERVPDLKVAIVECNMENLSQLSEQLRQIEGIELYSYLLQTIEEYPYKLGEEMDLIVTTAEHVAFLSGIVPERKKIARIALRLSPQCVAPIVKLHAGETVGILSCSQRFGQLLYEACETYAEHVNVVPPQLFSEELDYAAFFRGKTAVLVPEEFERYISDETSRLLQQMDLSRKLIRCSYEMDEGSYLYLQEKIGRLREKKTIS